MERVDEDNRIQNMQVYRKIRIGTSNHNKPKETKSIFNTWQRA